MAHQALRVVTSPLAAAASQATAPSTQNQILSFCSPKVRNRTTTMLHYYHFGPEAERWAISSYKLATTTPPSIKGITKTSQLKASQPMTTTNTHTHFTDINKVPSLIPTSKRFNTTANMAFHTRTEAASERVWVRDEQGKRILPIRETSCEFSRVQHALREARWKALRKEGQRMKEERAMRAVALEAEVRNSGSGMFCSLW